MFSAYKSVIVTPCACDLFVSKVTKITWYMDVRFWRSFFSTFSVCDDCILKSTTAWLLKLSVLYIHSFMQVRNTIFQIKTVFNNVLFSTEVHNPLHNLLALSHIYIIVGVIVYNICHTLSHLQDTSSQVDVTMYNSCHTLKCLQDTSNQVGVTMYNICHTLKCLQDTSSQVGVTMYNICHT